MTSLKQMMEALPEDAQARKDYEHLIEVVRFLDQQDAMHHKDCTRCPFLGRGDPLVDPRAREKMSEDGGTW